MDSYFAEFKETVFFKIIKDKAMPVYHICLSCYSNVLIQIVFLFLGVFWRGVVLFCLFVVGFFFALQLKQLFYVINRYISIGQQVFQTWIVK